MTCAPREPFGHPVISAHEDHDTPVPRGPPDRPIFAMDELIRRVAQRAAISPAQATLAIAEMLAFLTTRLPSPVVGRIREQLSEAPGPRKPDQDQTEFK